MIRQYVFRSTLDDINSKKVILSYGEDKYPQHVGPSYSDSHNLLTSKSTMPSSFTFHCCGDQFVPDPGTRIRFLRCKCGIGQMATIQRPTYQDWINSQAFHMSEIYGSAEVLMGDYLSEPDHKRVDCRMCQRVLNNPDDPLSEDCGGDCWGCIGLIEAVNEDYVSLKKVIWEIVFGVRRSKLDIQNVLADVYRITDSGVSIDELIKRQYSHG